MKFLIGTDEAGYGPNLGPLMVTGTLWSTDCPEQDLYRSLAAAVQRERNTDARDPKILIADSKQIYQSTGSIEALETSVLAILYALTDQVPSDWSKLAKLICPAQTIAQVRQPFWLLGQRRSLPVLAKVDRIKILGQRFRETATSAGVGLIKIQSVPVFAPQFNSQVSELGNKATLLSAETLQIVKRLLNHTDGDVEVGCDKHGGRRKYASLIQRYLTGALLSVGSESAAVSRYCYREGGRNVSIAFQAKGESFLPTALASMVSKYMREIFMMIWNDFWQQKIPDLKPTKGYPVDAKRFKRDIAAVLSELEIDDDLIWRVR